jgi:hypothetical protein
MAHFPEKGFNFGEHVSPPVFQAPPKAETGRDKGDMEYSSSLLSESNLFWPQ